MRRRFLETGEIYSTRKTTAPTRRNLQEFRERFQSTTGRRGPSTRSSTTGSVISEVDIGEEEVEVSGRTSQRINLRSVADLGPFCEYLGETLFRKGARITNKQQMKTLALEHFEQSEPSSDLPTVNVRIALLNVVCNGYGDVVFAHKFFTYLIDSYPNCTIHLLTTNLEAYRELGLDEVPSGGSRQQQKRHEIKQLLLKPKFVGEEWKEQNLADECRFNLSHLQLDTSVPYNLIFVAPIVYAGDATIGKIRKLIPYSRFCNTYFVSDYNMRRYEKAVTNVDLPTGLGPNNYGLLFSSCHEPNPPRLSEELATLLPIRYGLASMSIERPAELNCFGAYVTRFLGQYANEEVIDLVISPDIVQAILRSRKNPDYEVVVKRLIRTLTESTNYSMSMSYTEGALEEEEGGGSSGALRTTAERYQRYRCAQDEEEFEVVEEQEEEVEQFSDTSSISGRGRSGGEDTRSAAYGSGRKASSVLEWKNEVFKAANTIPQQETRRPTKNEVIFYNKVAGAELRPVQLLRLRGDIFPVMYEQVAQLFSNAAPPVLVSGDQNLSDLLACNDLPGNVFLYQIRPWKKTFAKLLGEQLGLEKLLSNVDKCTDQRGTVTVSAAVPSKQKIERFRNTNNFERKAKSRMDAIVNMIATNLNNPTGAWNMYVNLVDGKNVVKDIKTTLRTLCRRTLA